MNPATNTNNAATSDTDKTRVLNLSSHLRLLTAQLDISLHESDQPYNHLTHLFTTLIEEIQKHTQSGKINPEYEAYYRELQRDIHDAIIAVQYYDRMHQRIELVRNDLTEIITAVDTQGSIADKVETDIAEEKISSLYSSKQQRQMLQYAANAGPREFAFDEEDVVHKGEDDNPDIELF